MASIIGLTLVKINGIYELDVTNASWQNPRSVSQHDTGAGVKNAIGNEHPSGSFDEVISKNGTTNWRALSAFSIQIYDKETRKIVVASFERCDWDDVGGSSDSSAPSTKKKIAWKGEATTSV